MVKISKKILLLVFSILLIVGLFVGYYFYREATRKYNHFFLNPKIYSVNMGIDPNYWSSYYFQPIVESVNQNDDGVVLNVKYKNSDSNWVKTKILVFSEKYNIKNVLFFNSMDERTKAFKPSEHLIDSLEKAKKVVPKNQQIIVALYQDFPNKDQRTDPVCVAIKNSYGMDLCSITNTIDTISPKQFTFWDSESVGSDYLIPNFLVFSSINED